MMEPAENPHRTLAQHTRAPPTQEEEEEEAWQRLLVWTAARVCTLRQAWEHEGTPHAQEKEGERNKSREQCLDSTLAFLFLYTSRKINSSTTKYDQWTNPPTHIKTVLPNKDRSTVAMWHFYMILIIQDKARTWRIKHKENRITVSHTTRSRPPLHTKVVELGVSVDRVCLARPETSFTNLSKLPSAAYLGLAFVMK